MVSNQVSSNTGVQEADAFICRETVQYLGHGHNLIAGCPIGVDDIHIP